VMSLAIGIFQLLIILGEHCGIYEHFIM
jgi:hypothetical protein